MTPTPTPSPIPTPTPTPTPIPSQHQHQSQSQSQSNISFRASPNIFRFITTAPIPQLKASLSIKDDWSIAFLINKIQSTINSETSDHDFVVALSSNPPTHRLILEQDGIRLPSDESCSIVDRSVIICVRLIPRPNPIGTLIPNSSFTTSTPITTSNDSGRLIPAPATNQLICPARGNLFTPNQNPTRLSLNDSQDPDSTFASNYPSTFTDDPARSILRILPVPSTSNHRFESCFQLPESTLEEVNSQSPQLPPVPSTSNRRFGSCFQLPESTLEEIEPQSSQPPPPASPTLPSPSRSTKEKSVVPKIEDTSDVPFARSHIEAFRKVAARHYRDSSDSSSSSSERSHPYTEDEDDYKPKKKIRFSKPRGRSAKKKRLRSLTKNSIRSTEPKQKQKEKRYNSFVCVKIPKVVNKLQSTSIKIESPEASTSYSPPRLISSSSSNSIPTTPVIRSSKRSIYEVFMTDLTFKAASTQGPLRITPSSQGLNPSCTIQQLSKHLKLEKHQSWKIKIGSKVWINNHHDDDDDDHLGIQSEQSTTTSRRRSSSHFTTIMKDWELSLGFLGVSPMNSSRDSNSQSDFQKIEVIRNWDM